MSIQLDIPGQMDGLLKISNNTGRTKEKITSTQSTLRSPIPTPEALFRSQSMIIAPWLAPTPIHPTCYTDLWRPSISQPSGKPGDENWGDEIWDRPPISEQKASTEKQGPPAGGPFVPS